MSELGTASDVIDFLGGTSKTAGLFDVLPSAVSNWRKTGFPPRLHYRVAKLVEARGGKASDSLFGPEPASADGSAAA